MSIPRALALGCSLVVILWAIDTRAAVLRPGDVVVSGGDQLIRIDPKTGNRTLLSGPSRGMGVAIQEPQDIALGPDGKIYVAEPNSNSVIRVDPESGDREIVSASPTLDSNLVVGNGPAFRNPTGLAFERSGKLLVVNRDTLMRLDTATGARTLVSGSQVGAGHELDTEIGAGIALDKAGNAYISSYWGNYIITVDTATGDRSGQPGDLSIGHWARLSGLALSDAGTLLALGNGTILAIDPATGSVRTVSATREAWSAQIAIDSHGNLIAAQNHTVFAIGQGDAEGKILSDSIHGSGAFFGGATGVLVVPIPEPSTLVQAGMGLMTLLALAISRRKTR